MINKDNILKLIAEGEHEQLEFKLNFGSKAIVAINALANTNGGHLIIGVSDKAELIGVDLNKESLQNWVNEIKQKTEPSILPQIINCVINDKQLLVFSVPEFPIKPVAFQGKFYARKNNANHLLSVDEIVEYRFNSLNWSFDSFLVDTTRRDLSKKAIDRFIILVNENGKFSFSENIEHDFGKLGLFNGAKATRAAELLFGNHNTTIHLGRFKTPTTIIDDIIIKQPLVFAVEDAMTFIKKNIQAEYVFTGELQRKSNWQYPLQAIREILLNAIIHKNYQDSTDVIVKIFDNKIEVSNPGNLYGNLSLELLNTDDYKPKHRNRLLTEAFYLMGEVEKYGTGLIRVRNWIKDYKGLLFHFIEQGGSMVAILDWNKTKNNLENNLENDLENDLENQLSLRQIDILAAIKQNNKITQQKLSESIGISPKNIRIHINKLKNKNRLKRVGPAKGGYWQIIEE